jgi:hypothetical protein
MSSKTTNEILEELENSFEQYVKYDELKKSAKRDLLNLIKLSA